MDFDGDRTSTRELPGKRPGTLHQTVWGPSPCIDRTAEVRSRGVHEH